MQDKVAPGRVALRRGIMTRTRKRKVQEATLAAAHRTKVKRFSGRSHLEQRFPRVPLESLVSLLFKGCRIEAEAIMLFWRKPARLGRNVLKRKQELAIALQQQRNIKAGEIDHKQRH